MDAALLSSALLMGLAGGPHCAAMCGAAQLGVAGPGRRSMLALQLGRVAGYALAGAVVASSVSLLGELGRAGPLLRPVWTLFHVGALALGLGMAWRGRVPAWLSTLGQRRPALASGAQPLHFVSRLPRGARAATAGACWTLLPCGLLQSALVVAALASDAAWGALVMAGFAAGSALGLAAVSLFWTRLRGRATADVVPSTASVRLAGVLLAGASGFALVHGLQAAIGQAFCLPA
jgi:sulfite exporter TauE/SafE